MSYKFCKKCGTLYSEADGECPRCTDKRLTGEGMRDTVYDTRMSAEELEKRRRSDWKHLIIGVPAFIAFIYVIFVLYNIIATK